MTELAAAYQNGVNGTSRNLDLATYWFEKAADFKVEAYDHAKTDNASTFAVHQPLRLTMDTDSWARTVRRFRKTTSAAEAVDAHIAKLAAGLTPKEAAEVLGEQDPSPSG